MSASARRYSHLLHTPDVKNPLRVSSKDRYLTRSIQSTTAGDFLSGDKNARYSISYLPGVSEHDIDTGKTLAEAQMKIVVFACEVERLSSQNYQLVKENEVLRTQTHKSEREKDLETKLAIVLAENEKLNHIIEDVYNTYMAERGAQTNETYEKRIAMILQELEQWKQRCGTLNGNQGDHHGAENTLRAIEEENRRLIEALGEKDREIETLRARLDAKGASEEVSVLEGKIIWLVEENTRLKDNMKNGGSEEQERLLREYKEKMRMLLAENDNLSELIKTRLQDEAPVREVNTSLKPKTIETVKMAGVQGHPEVPREELRKKDADIAKLAEKLSALLAENEKLNEIVERQMEHIDVLEKQHGRSSELFSKTEMVTSMNEHLNHLLREKLEENQSLKKLTGQFKNNTINSEEFNTKVRALLEHNDELNNLVREKVNEVQDLKIRLNFIAESDGIMEELKNKLLIVTTENERLNRLLIEKIDEVEKIRREEQAAAQRRNETGNEDMLKRIRELEATVQEQRNRLQLVTVENERLNSLIGHQLNEGEQIRKRLSEIDHNAMKMQELNRTIDILREENERMNRLVMEKHNEAEKLKASRNDSLTGELQTKLMLTSQENLRLDAITVEKIAELEKAKRQIKELEEANATKIPGNVDRLVEENEKLSALVIEKIRENDELKVRLQAVIAENDRLNNIALHEANYNKQLTNKMDEMRKSAVEAHSASVELSDWKAKYALLSAENERLSMFVGEKSQEVKILRVRIGELEGGYAKVTDLEEKLVLVCSENQRVLEEIERLRAKAAEDRTQELEVRVCELLREKDILATHIETLQNEIDGINNQHIHVVNTLNVNLERHQEELKKAGAHHQRKEEEMECKDRRIAELEGDIEMMKKTLDDRARTIEQFEEKLIIKSAEKERLGLVVEEKNREVEEIEGKLVEEMRKSQTLEEKLVDELRKSQTLLAEEIECERRKSAGEKEMLEKSIHMLEEENKRLQAHLNHALMELEEAKKQLAELEMIRAQELNDFKDQFETLKDINKEIKELQVKSSAERMAYETQIAQLKMSIADFERERDLLLSENERLTALSVQRLEELERVKRTTIEVEEVSKLEISELKSKVEESKAHMHDIKQLALKYSAEKAADQSQINQLKELNDNYKAEIKKLYELLDERKVDLESLQSLNEGLRQSQSQLIVRFKQQTETEVVPSQEKLEDLQMQFQELEKTKNEYKHQAERNSIELTRRNGELVDKIQQLDVLKMKYEEAFANYQALNFKLFERLSVEK